MTRIRIIGPGSARLPLAVAFAATSDDVLGVGITRNGSPIGAVPANVDVR